MKYFMEKDDEYTYDLNYFKDMVMEEDIEKIELLEMKRDYGGEMWCDEDQGFVEKGNECVQCPKYNPCNGKSGRCRYLKNGFIETGKKFVLTKFVLAKFELKEEK